MITCLLNATVPGSPYAGILSGSVRKVIVKKTAQRAALKGTVQKRTAQKSIKKSVAAKSTGSKTAKKEMLATRAESQRANRLYREGKMSWKKKIAQNRKYDAWKHEHGNLPVKKLKKDKKVQKYYSSVHEAKDATKNGIKPGRHLTATTHGPGRESFKKAKFRYGLLEEPKARVTVQLHKGQKYVSTKAAGGGRGVGEYIPVKKIPAKDVSSLYTVH